MRALPEGITQERWQGIEVLRVETPSSLAHISLHGGQVLSFVPTGFDDLLWVSPTTTMPPKAIRGGVPVCWPYFGRQGQPDDAPQHGHARISRWPLTDVRRETDGSVVLKLALPLRDGVPLELIQTVHVGRDLRQSLDTLHRGEAPIVLTQALHTYFRVGDALQVRVTGLDGLRYADKFDGRTHVQTDDWTLHDPRDPGRSDRIYTGTGHRFDLLDPVGSRRIRLDTFGSRSLVVWNPGEAGAAAIGDLPDDGWRSFVCLEAANAGEDAIELEPGQRHRLSHVISATPL
ncbi:D-hexose-6-phosphate mutarotase [Pseudoxanthomonas sp. Root630]|uniref:D-hexose-6-phosphate mutarotase n=1 Tax=Pseudoxanthomonas sp. Root630 TaxID=1736574 RepID=UPI0007025250|nr:D-hexose-6-phosphate mutarotase [Pseudoxanthomonas sp. Root630]KRA45061.1 D-hexose-6-phosphate mutarotase [Pseudoxanthomonas sp. Root630]